MVHGRLQNLVWSSWRVFPATLPYDLSPQLPYLYLSPVLALVVLFLFYQQTLHRCILPTGKDQDPNSFLQTKRNSCWVPPFNSRPKLTVQCQPILIYFCSIKWNLNHSLPQSPSTSSSPLPQGPVLTISSLYMESFCAYVCVVSLDCASFLSRALNKSNGTPGIKERNFCCKKLTMLYYAYQPIWALTC